MAYNSDRYIGQARFSGGNGAINHVSHPQYARVASNQPKLVGSQWHASPVFEPVFGLAFQPFVEKITRSWMSHQSVPCFWLILEKNFLQYAEASPGPDFRFYRLLAHF